MIERAQVFSRPRALIVVRARHCDGYHHYTRRPARVQKAFTSAASCLIIYCAADGQFFFPSISHAANTSCVCARPSWPHTPAPAFLLYESVRRTDGDREISRCTYTGSSAGRKENAEKTVRLATRKKIAEKTGRERSKTSFYPSYI